MNKVPLSKYKNKIKKLNGILRDQDYDVIVNKSLKILYDGNEYFKDNYYDLNSRRSELYNNEIKPLMVKIEMILSNERNKMIEKIANDRDEIMKNNIAIEIKNKNQWLLENATLYSEEIKKLYTEVLRDIEKCKERKNIIAVDPDGAEKTYPTAYRAAKVLEIHPATITYCCKGERYMRSGKSKKDGKSYSFHYEGETPSPRNTERRAKLKHIDKVLDSYNKS